MAVVVVYPLGSSVSGGDGPRECRENLRCNESRLAKTSVSDVPVIQSDCAKLRCSNERGTCRLLDQATMYLAFVQTCAALAVEIRLIEYTQHFEAGC
jgi:hypothetical protein